MEFPQGWQIGCVVAEQAVESAGGRVRNWGKVEWHEGQNYNAEVNSYQGMPVMLIIGKLENGILTIKF